MDYRETNPNKQLYQGLKELPKIDLHRHLEGSLRLSTMAEIASEYHLDLPGYNIDDFRSMVQITAEDKPEAVVFLSKFKTLRHFFRSPEIVERVAYEAVADAAEENIVYFEMRFTPMALAREGHYPLHEAADWVIKSTQRAAKDFGIDVRLIVSINRHESVELGEKCLEIAIKRMGDGIVGMDLAGAENRFPGEPFAPIFRQARDAGLHITVHAGEWAGPESVREAIDKLGAMRLGHGVRIVEDKKLMQIAKDRRIPLEVCLSSNAQSGVVPTLKEHPLRELYEFGLLTTINTDDPSISAINLTDEFVVAMEHLQFNLDVLREHVLNAAEAAFLSDAEKKQLVAKLNGMLYPEKQIKAAAQSRR